MASLAWTKLSVSSDGKLVPCARSSHGVSLVRNGRHLIVYGGEHIARTPLEASEACWAVDNLNDKNPTWRLVDSTNGPSPRIAHAQAVVEDKYVYVFGGRAGITMKEQALNDLWMLDCSGEPGTETWSQVSVATTEADLPEARSFHRMVSIGSNLYVFGGCGATSGRLADLYRFDTTAKTWHSLGKSGLAGRGGPNLLPLASGQRLGVVAGFAGKETADGQVFDLKASSWGETLLGKELEGMRPRSVCVSESFPSLGVSVIFGGEVDPSDRGHEGAGGFESDVVVLDESNASFKKVVTNSDSSPPWPMQRGWSASASLEKDGTGHLFVFGGLSGDDTNPTRLDDLWRLDITK